MDIIKKLNELGYHAQDIHWLHSFYNIGMNITSPNTTQRIQQDQIDLENSSALQKLVNGEDNFYIDQAINFGRVGLTYKDVKFKSKEYFEEITIELPRGFKNVGITTDNFLTANTNDSKNWDTLKFPLPIGKWAIKAYSVNGGHPNKKSVILRNIS